MQGLLKKILSNSKFGEFKTMNIMRIKIIAFWLLFILFWILMYFCWRYRFLWAALFPAAVVMIELIKPQRRSQMPAIKMPPAIKISLWLVVIAFVLTVVIHGILFPHSAVIYLIGKIACGTAAATVLCYKVRLDYGTFRAAQNASAEPGA